MTAQERLADVARQLKDGETVQPLTVREFLSWFSAQRRGYYIVEGIRHVLTGAGLATEPDFEAAYIDSPIRLVALTPPRESPAGPQGADVAAVLPATASITASLSVVPVYADPTYRISRLAAANNPPVSVTPDASLQAAVTIMIGNDFSQLPVMTSTREVKGIISWTSIGSCLSLGRGGAAARDLMDPHHEIRADASLFQAIPIIVQHDYVLIRGTDNQITGIVTASDLSLQFQQLAEPFLLIGEIENHIRRVLSTHFTPTELATIRDPTDTERVVETVADLTFGEYQRLFENPELWGKVRLSIDRATFVTQLDKVREIRNDIMHFDPDPIPPEDLDQLRNFARFLQRLQSLGLT